MRLLVVTNLYPPDVIGGYELLALDVVERLRERGHQVDVLCSATGETGGGVFRQLRLVRPFGQPLGRARLAAHLAARHNLSAVRAYLRERGLPDAALAMSQRRLGLDVLRELGRRGCPVVATVNDDWPLAYCRTRPRGLRGLAGAVLDRSVSRNTTFHGIAVASAIYLSPTLRQATIAAGAPLPFGVIQAQGVDRRSFAARPMRPFRTPLELAYVGRLHPSKAPDVALDTLAALRRRGIIANLTVAGAPHDEGYGRELQAHAARIGVDGQVRWLGAVARDRLPEIYRAADLFLFTCRFELEGQGLTYLEAMSCGVPVVAYPAGGARDLLAGTGAAAIASRCDGDALASEIAPLLDAPARAAQMVEHGFTLLDRSASLERYVDVVEAQLVAA